VYNLQVYNGQQYTSIGMQNTPFMYLKENTEIHYLLKYHKFTFHFFPLIA